MDAENMEQIKSTIRDQTRILLEQWSRERDEGGAAAAPRTVKEKPRKQP
jgi:hypothetical protein